MYLFLGEEEVSAFFFGAICFYWMLNVFFFCGKISSCQIVSQILSYPPALKVIPSNHWKDPWTTLGSAEKFLNCSLANGKNSAQDCDSFSPPCHSASGWNGQESDRLGPSKMVQILKLSIQVGEIWFQWDPRSNFSPIFAYKKMGGRFLHVCLWRCWKKVTPVQKRVFSWQFESCRFLLRIRYTHHNRVSPSYGNSDNQDYCNYLGRSLYVNSKPEFPFVTVTAVTWKKSG